MALFAVVVALLLVSLNWYVGPTKPSEKKDLVLALAQILGGTALLSGLYFTWRTLQINREGQITERFTRAIDQLGSKELEIRLGGIYALERIARDSERDHWTIMEVLSAYVRQHARWLPERGQEGAQEGAEDTAVEMREEDSRGTSKTTGGQAHAPDIEAIMTVLRRRTRSFGDGERESLDLRKTNLPRAHLSSANLAGADLSSAYLAGANLAGADLGVANLGVANLSEAMLLAANLSGAVLLGANLTRANLLGANFTGAMLSIADFREADLGVANLRGASLTGARNLIQAQLEKTKFGDENTKLPPNLKPPAHWGVKTDEQTEEE